MYIALSFNFLIDTYYWSLLLTLAPPLNYGASNCHSDPSVCLHQLVLLRFCHAF